MRQLITFLASAGFLGYAPVASGTFGTLAAIPLFYLLDQLRLPSPLLYVAILIVSIAFACWIADQAEKAFQEHDSGKIVIDEVVGYLTTVLFIPWSIPNAVAAFFIFRLFDIIKPFPAGLIDRKLPGGTGVVLDDVAAGVYGNLSMQILVAWQLLG